jgi:ABC-type multidrug transport system ATPase subunit
MSIIIQDLSKTYPNGTQALRHVSLHIPTGMFGLLGANGAGKSSLMRTLATLQEPDSGSILFNGLDVLKHKQRMRQLLGYLPQEFGVYPGISAERLLHHFAALKGITRVKERQEQVKFLLHQTNLYEVRHKAVSGYSGGMRRRFGIAQALLGNPQLLIVDEPTAGLDPAERVRFLNLLSQLGENATVILSTHIVEDIAELCSNLAIMAQGQVLLTGQPQQLMNQLAGKIWMVEIPRDRLPCYQQKFQVISHKFYLGQLRLHIYSNDALTADFTPVQPDLEDVYFCAIAGLLGNQLVMSERSK